MKFLSSIRQKLDAALDATLIEQLMAEGAQMSPDAVCALTLARE
jgi:hypothetical protein